MEAVKTNIDGAMNIVDAALDCGVKRVVALSTDKAVNPINLYGGTKLVSDKLFIAANAYSGARMYVFLSCVMETLPEAVALLFPFSGKLLQMVEKSFQLQITV